MTELFSLGRLYVSDFLAEGEEPRGEPHELRLMMDDDTAVVRLASQPPPELMWGKYWYRSRINRSMRLELQDIVLTIKKWVTVEPGEVWVDIASNDGTLLSYVDTPDGAFGRIRVGIDPADDTFREEAEKHADLIIQQPFSIGAWKTSPYGDRRAKVVTCIAMFYDLLDPTDFLKGVRQLLADDGIFVLQLSYTPLMLRQLAFDNICHEHARYYTLHTLKHTLNLAGFEVIDCELNPTNGGSMRVFARHKGPEAWDRFGTQPMRDVGQYRVQSILHMEADAQVNQPWVWHRFIRNIDELKVRLRTFLRAACMNGETVWGYGASTKGNTLLQFFELDSQWLEAIADASPYKHGLRTVGTNIPIVSESEMREVMPDYLLILPWHFIGEFKRREYPYLAKGGKFIVPLPQLQIIGA